MKMAMGDVIKEYRDLTGTTQSFIAKHLHVDRALVSRAESGKERLSETHDAAIASINWRLALEVIDERSGGYISNITKLDPTIDLSPAGLKERLQKDLQEAMKALNNVYTFMREPDKEPLEKAWHEITDVIEVASVARGVYEEQFGLNHKELVKIHNQQRKEHKR
jgi:transcriptional regulator with XRE-family HTH domain